MYILWALLSTYDVILTCFIRKFLVVANPNEIIMSAQCNRLSLFLVHLVCIFILI